MFHCLNDKGDNSLTEISLFTFSAVVSAIILFFFICKIILFNSKCHKHYVLYTFIRLDTNSLFRASGYFGQRIISHVIEAVKHSPFYIWFSPPKDGRLVVVRGSDVTPEKRIIHRYLLTGPYVAPFFFSFFLRCCPHSRFAIFRRHFWKLELKLRKCDISDICWSFEILTIR